MCNFHDLCLVTIFFYELTHFFRLNEEYFTFYLQYKHFGTFANRNLRVNMKNCHVLPQTLLECVTPF